MKLLHGVTLCGLLLSWPVWGKHWHEDQDDWNWHVQHQDQNDHADHRKDKGCYFEPHDVRLISEYDPPRLRLNIPPGLEKKIHRNGNLPPGWETRLELLSVTVERLLVPIPAEFRRGILDGVAVVYSPQSGLIIDATPLIGRR